MAFNPLKVLNDLFVREQAVLNKGLVVSGSVSGSTGVYVKKDVVVGGDLIVSGTVENAGYAQAGALQVDGILDVAGNSYLSGAVEVVGNLNVDGRLSSDELLIDSGTIQQRLAVGTNVFIAKKQTASSSSYVYANPKLFITPELVSGSVVAFVSSSVVDMNTIDPSIMSGTMAIDVAKSLNSVDDYLIRLREVIEF